MDFESIASAAGLVSRVVHRRLTVRVDSAGILHVLGGQPFTWGPSSEWRRPDLNRRSLGYEPSGLPSFPTPRRHVHPREVHMLAGDVLPVWGVVICRSLEAGPCRSALCRVASVGTVCPTYLPRALFSCGPRANRAGGAGCIVAAPARSTYRIVWWQFVREDIPSLPIRESVTSRLLRSSVQAKHTCPSRRTRLPRILCGRRRGWSRTGCRVRPPSGPGSGLLGFPRRT